jgi:hypothetical protein
MTRPETIARIVNADARLLWRGRHVDAVMLLGVGPREWRLDIRRGRVAEAGEGPFVMPSCTFRLAAAEDDWAAFWRPVPPPGRHDILALLKRRALTMTGDLHPLMANLFYFKGVLEAPRRAA